MHRIALFAAVAVATLVAAWSGAGAQTKIVFNSFAPPKFVINQGMIDVWAKNVEKVTEGRVTVDIPASSLAPPQQQWETVTQGVADGAYIFNAFARKRLLLPQIAHLPFVTPTATAQAVALWRLHKERFERANEYEGVTFLGYFGSPAAHLFSMTDKPIEEVSDLKDVKTWSLPGDQARALAKLGAVIVPGPAVRSYEIISKGIVNAYGGHNCDSSYSFNIAQFAKAITFIPGGMGSAAFSVFLNQQKWDGIPKRDQELIMNVSGEELAKLSKAWDDRETESCERMRSEGKIKMINASPELMATLKREWAFLEEEWVANANSRNIDGRAALVRYQQLTEQLSK